MEIVKNTQKSLLKGVIVLVGTISVMSLIIWNESSTTFITGLIFGAIIGFLNFRLMYITLTKAVKMQPHRAQGYAFSNYMARYTITGVVLYVSLKADHINVIGVVIGLFALKLVIIKNELFQKAFLKQIFKRKEENK